MVWNYRQPVKLIFGNGRVDEIQNLLVKSRRPLLVCDVSAVKNKVSDRVLAMHDAMEIFSDISPNPDVTQVDRCSALIREKQVDHIVALGGGSVIDLAKAASAAVERIEEYHGTGKPIPEIRIPLTAVPTTSGTGSEVTCVSVLTNRKTGKKAPINSDYFYPKTAVIDPELTYTLPPQVTASCGIDVLCHAVEGYWSRGHQPICSALAIHAIRTVFAYLPVAYRQPENRIAREKMAEASVMAGLAFTLPKTTSSHACSFPLTSRYGIPHGEACGLTLDYFIRFNAADSRTQELSDLLGYRSTDDFADAVLELKRELHLRTNLRDLLLSGEQIRELIRQSHHPNLDNNPVTVSDKDLERLYQSLR
ncbi:MAG: iron-containing alcohol dehydrogenase [Clostridiales bacterium]|nr:iron-containing alcohol dehydrogenase [Clostridiales bacterium]